MNTDPENFESVKRLLALKRHEQPPPRYFNDFSNKVLERLQTSGAASTSWWQRLGLDLDWHPALVCATGVCVCGLLALGVISTIQMGASSSAASSSAGASPLNVVAVPLVPSLPGGNVSDTPQSPAELPGSTAPILSAQASSSPFNQFTVRAQQASLTFGTRE